MTHAHPGSPGRTLRRCAGIVAALGFLIAAGSAEAHPRHKHKHRKHHHHARHHRVVYEPHCAPVVYAPVAYHRVYRPGYWHTATSGVQVAPLMQEKNRSAPRPGTGRASTSNRPSGLMAGLLSPSLGVSSSATGSLHELPLGDAR